jgi:hypothetical protein
MPVFFEQRLNVDFERPFMKKIQLLAVVGLVLALGVVARAESGPKPTSVTIVGVTGEARYSIDGTTWHPLVVGKILHEGAVIETAEGSSADLVLSGTAVPAPIGGSSPMNQGQFMLSQAPDPNVRSYEAYKPIAQQNVIRMGSGTMLAVDKLTEMNTGADTVGDTELDLRAGNVFLNVKKMSADSQFIIKLPNGVAGIRGSWGTLSADDSCHWGGGTIILSLIVNGKSSVLIVKGGFGYDPATGRVYILAPGVIEALRMLSHETTTLVVQLKPLPGDLTLIYLSPSQGNQNGQGGT